MKNSHDGTQLRDAVGAVIEKVLVSLGQNNHDKIVKILKDQNITFADCLEHPDVLNGAFKKLFGTAYHIPVDRISYELRNFGTDKNLSRFLKGISQ